jgi:hypothetical protein
MRRNMRRLAKEMDPSDDDGDDDGEPGFGSPLLWAASTAEATGAAAAMTDHPPSSASSSASSSSASSSARPLGHAMLSSLPPASAQHLQRAYGDLVDVLAAKVASSSHEILDAEFAAATPLPSHARRPLIPITTITLSAF